MDTSIQTASGVLVYLDDPDSSPVTIEDIGAALSRICRFNGHLREAPLYSVAQHSVLVSEHCEDPKAGLLHDAAEAYLGDMTTQLKNLIPEFRVLEARWERRIEMQFDLPEGALASAAVKRADMQALATEARDLCARGVGRDAMMSRAVQWPDQIYCRTQPQALSQFLRRAKELGIR